MTQTAIDERWMQLALQQAVYAVNCGEVPVGAVLVDDKQQCLAKAHNQPITAVDPTAHAEIVLLRQAAQKINNYRLLGTTLYVTLEPCVMCLGAMTHARIERLVYALPESKSGAVESRFHLTTPGLFNHTIEITAGVGREQSLQLLQQFFKERR